MVPYNGDHSLTFFLLEYFVGRVEFQLTSYPTCEDCQIGFGYQIPDICVKKFSVHS